MPNRMESLWSDVRFAWTVLWKRPALTVLAICALVVGIAATSAIFSVFKTVLLDPLAYRNPERLVVLWGSDLKRGNKEVEVSYGELEDWRKQNQVFEDLAGISSVNLDFAITGKGEPQQVDGTIASGSFFSILGTRAAHGRTFTEDDDKPGSAAKIVISDRLWRNRYGADPKLIGQDIVVGGGPAQVIGVMPPGFDFPKDVDIWAPLRAASGLDKSPTIRVMFVLGRMKPGITREKASAEMNVIAQRLEQNQPVENRGIGVHVSSLAHSLFGNAQPALYVLLGAVVLVLLIACANVGNLLLAKATARQREMAVRAALGASRRRLMQQMLVESTLLAVLGALAAMVLLTFGLKLILVLAPADIPRIGEVEIDAFMLLFTTVLSLATVVLFGMVPALQASNPNVTEAIKENSSNSSGAVSRTRLRGALVAIEVALSVLLMVGAGLLMRSFQRLQSIDPGFRRENILTMRITLGAKNGATQEKRRNFYQAVLDRVRPLPGVESAAAVLLRPLSGNVGWDNAFTVEGQTQDEQAGNPTANYEAISPDYFRTMSIPILRGRDFTRADVEGAPGVVVLNRSLAERLWPGQDPIGKRLRLGRFSSKQPWLSVVGIAKDVRYREWETPRVDIYVPFTQRAQHRTDIVVRTAGDPASLAQAVRREIYALDPEQAVSNVTTMENLVDAALARPRFNVVLLGVFASSALLLAIIGVFGVLSYLVTQRTREIGIRMALGSRPDQVLRLVVGQGLRMVIIGLAAGIAGALALNRLLSALLHEVKPTDPATYLGVIGLMLLIGVAACLVPAWRASRVDPLKALQYE